MKNKKNKELAVCGFEAVKALEKNNFEMIQRLYLQLIEHRFLVGFVKSWLQKKCHTILCKMEKS